MRLFRKDHVQRRGEAIVLSLFRQKENMATQIPPPDGAFIFYSSFQRNGSATTAFQPIGSTYLRLKFRCDNPVVMKASSEWPKTTKNDPKASQMANESTIVGA
jgi:hypothetical protein